MRVSQIPSSLWIAAQLAVLGVTVAIVTFCWATLSFMWPIWRLPNDQKESKPNENETDNKIQEFINSVRYRMYNYAEETLEDLGKFFWPKHLSKVKENILAVSNLGNPLSIPAPVDHQGTAEEEQLQDSFEWPEAKFGDTSQEEFGRLGDDLEEIGEVHFHPALLEMLQKFDRSGHNQDKIPMIQRPVTLKLTQKLEPLMTPSLSLTGTYESKGQVNWNTVTTN